MNKTKKISNLILVLVMMFALNITAFAADNANYTITIDNETSGYTYVACQIFKGDLSDGILSNIEFGSALSETDQAALLAVYADVLDENGYESSAAGLAEALNDGKITAAEFAEEVAEYDLNAAGTSSYSTDNQNYTITVNGSGYYLVKNTEVPLTDSAYSDYILQVVADITVEPKAADTPELDKTVGDESTSDDATEDYAIGDDVPFTLTAVLPQGYSNYSTYSLIFNDTLSDGLTFNSDSVSVTIDGAAIPASCYTVSDVTGNDDGTTSFTVTFADLKSIEVEGLTISAGSKVVVTYTAALNENAEAIENNDAYLTFSNNPNDSDSTSTTPDDKTYVVTFTVTVNKTDEDGSPLSGAAFALYTKDTNEEYTVLVKEFTVDDTTTSFAFNGLAIGDYMLVETSTPAGYNTIDNIYFTITAEAAESAGSETGVAVDTNVSSDDADFTVSVTSISTTVVNEKGSSLPSTGGMGTTIFYVVGGMLVLGAAAVLISRKRTRKEA